MTTTSRGLVHAVLWQLVWVAELMELAPFVPLTLRFELGDDGPELAAAVDGEVAPLARAAVRQALGRLLARPGDVDPATVRDLLAEDLAELARRAATTRGAPFGNHSRTVLLCDDVHAWATPPPNGGPAPLTGLECLLAMLDATGLGRAARPTPAVLTASTTLGAGEAVGKWSANGRPGFRFHPLEDLNPEERVVGYQWVLLHPWTRLRGSARPSHRRRRGRRGVDGVLAARLATCRGRRAPARRPEPRAAVRRAA